MLVVHKFGGTSVRDAGRIDASCRLVLDAPHQAIVVVSAMSGVTDRLLESAAAAGSGNLDRALELVEQMRKRHHETIEHLELPDAEEVRAQCDALLDEVDSLVRAASVVGSVGPRARDRIQSTGERLSVRMFAARMRVLGQASAAFDADRFLDTDDHFGSATPLEGLYGRGVISTLSPAIEASQIPVVTGFCGRSPDGATTTLGRGGSDYSATLVAAALGAEEVWIWTDVEGVLTADPSLVPDARLVPQLNYREAGELAYYGAKVLHPRTLKPVADLGIPVRIRNSWNPEGVGTLIDGHFTPGSHPVKSISAIGGHDLLSIEGTGMAGVPGVAARLFRSLADEEISVTMISQSSSESSISIAVPSGDADKAELAIRTEFRMDIARGDLEEVRRIPSVGLVAAVGLGMAQTPGIAGRVLRSVGDAGTNILAIAQGSSELNITFAVPARDTPATIAALHRELGLHREDTGDAEAPAFDLVILGWGNIARELVKLVQARNDAIEARFGLRGRVVLISDRSGFLLNPAGIPADALLAASNAKEDGKALANLPGGAAGSLADALNAALAYRLTHPVVVDLTDAGGARDLFATAFEGRADVVTANKKPLAGTEAAYRDLQARAQKVGRLLRAEATVGAGLPVVDTLEMLLVTGDRLTRADGCLSGTLAFVLAQLESGRRFSEAVREAWERGFTEPNPYADLSGADVGRKSLIISRIAGFEIPPEAIRVTGLVPDSLADLELEALFEALKAHDDEMAARVQAARAKGCVLRYVGSVTAERIEVGLSEVELDSPLGRLTGTDNMVVFFSERYSETPLVVQGPGAGVDVTAMGVLGDIVRVVAERSR